MNRGRFSGLLLLAGAALAQSPELVQVKAGNLSRNVPVTGEFAPYQSVDLHARVSGFVERITVDRGSVVNEGQLLATLSAPEMDAQLAEAQARAGAAEARVAEAKARLASAGAVAKRLKEASATPGAIAGSELETAEQAAEAARGQVRAAEAARKAALAAVESLENVRSYLRITAPFHGVVTDRMVHPGALASPQSGPLLRLQQVSPLRLVVALPEASYAAVSTGMRVPFRVAAWPGQTLHGRVSRIARAVDPKTRTMAVELDVPNPGGRLAPGMFAELDWPVATRSSLLVPATSVASTTERVFVIRVQNGRAEWVDVERGARSGDLVEVRGPLKPGDWVLRRASDEIRPGVSVTGYSTPKPGAS